MNVGHILGSGLLFAKLAKQVLENVFMHYGVQRLLREGNNGKLSYNAKNIFRLHLRFRKQKRKSCFLAT